MNREDTCVRDLINKTWSLMKVKCEELRRTLGIF